MSKFTFDCFVCCETLRTSNISAVLEFGAKHKFLAAALDDETPGKWTA